MSDSTNADNQKWTNFRDASRRIYGNIDDSFTYDQLMFGCLQRITDAVEVIAKKVDPNFRTNEQERDREDAEWYRRILTDRIRWSKVKFRPEQLDTVLRYVVWGFIYHKKKNPHKHLFCRAIDLRDPPQDPESGCLSASLRRLLAKVADAEDRRKARRQEKQAKGDTTEPKKGKRK